MLYIPCALKNYGLALLGVPFPAYVLATLAAEIVPRACERSRDVKRDNRCRSIA